jgi:hypothetical protein
MKVDDRVYLFCWPDYPGTVTHMDGDTVTIQYDNGEVGTSNQYDLELVQA